MTWSTEQEQTESIQPGFYLGYCVECQCRLSLRNRGEDGRCATCTWPDEIAYLRKLQTLRSSARFNADQALRAMDVAGHWARAWKLSDEDLADFAAQAARACYRACMAYQLAGGR